MNRRVAEGPTPASSRRPRQFRLRTLMLLVAAFAFAFAAISCYVEADSHGIARMIIVAVVIVLNVIRAVRHRGRRDEWGPLP